MSPGALTPGAGLGGRLQLEILEASKLSGDNDPSDEQIYPLANG